VRQAIEFVAQSWDRSAGDEALATVGLDELKETPVVELSSGQRTRVSLAIALVCRPAVACLDEPTGRLDAEGRVAATNVVASLAAQGSAVLVATHEEGFLAGLADTSLRLSGGRLQMAHEWHPSRSMQRRGARRSAAGQRSAPSPVTRLSSRRLVRTD
jgi:ABC-type multidrug transport system ATPase subunit